jgi:hypothetical protein
MSVLFWSFAVVALILLLLNAGWYLAASRRRAADRWEIWRIRHDDPQRCELVSGFRHEGDAHIARTVYGARNPEWRYVVTRAVR